MTVEVDERAPAALEDYRRELTGYCYRMLGSPFDADDAVQETLVRAWQGMDRFEGRSSLRSWLYRIATNVCLDSRRAGTRRALPMDLSSPVPSSSPLGEPLPEATWLQPIADADVLTGGDPADRAVLSDTVRLAFVAALQHLPPRQRATLILREVLAWPAAEVAELLETSVPSVNSALQRARATMATHDTTAATGVEALSEQDEQLLTRYVAAFQAYDIDGLVRLLHEDGSMSMPPLTLWVRGREEVRGFHLGHGSVCRGSRLLPLRMNGQPAYAQYHLAPDGSHTPWSIQVLDLSGGRIAHVHHFLGEALFVRLGLPLRLP